MRLRHPVRFAIFDLDGVLLDTEPLYTRAIAEVAARHGKVYDWSTKSQCIGRGTREAAQVIVDALALPVSAEELERLEKFMTRRQRVSGVVCSMFAGVAWAGVFAGCPSAFTPAPASPAGVARTSRILFDRSSPYGRVLVVDDGHERALRFGGLDGSDQSTIVPGRPGAVPLEYARYAVLGLAYHGDPRTLLMVGLGGGTFTTMVHRVLPEIAIDAVEIDPVVVEAARAFFGLREDERYRVHLADGAAWMATARGGPYDYVLLDSYGGESIPEGLRTVAFFRSVRVRLAARGVVAINVAEPQAEGAEAMRAFRAVFSVFACVRAPNDGNLVLFGTARPRDPPAPAAVAAWLAAWDARGRTEFSARALAAPGPATHCP